jgi:hypothetical protein
MGNKRILEPKRVEIQGDWGKLRNKKLRGLYSLDTVQVIKSRRINLAGLEETMGQREEELAESWWGRLKKAATCKT